MKPCSKDRSWVAVPYLIGFFLIWGTHRFAHGVRAAHEAEPVQLVFSRSKPSPGN